MQTIPTRHPDTESPQIVARSKKVPQNFPRKTAVPAALKTKFLDAGHWDELAAKHLPRHDLPAGDAPCSPDEMRRWLDRLNMTEKEYSQATNTGLADFCALNPAWPLRAWIGIVLELAHERRGG